MFEQGYFGFIYVYFCQEDGASFFLSFGLKMIIFSMHFQSSQYDLPIQRGDFGNCTNFFCKKNYTKYGQTEKMYVLQKREWWMQTIPSSVYLSIWAVTDDQQY